MKLRQSLEQLRAERLEQLQALAEVIGATTVKSIPAVLEQVEEVPVAVAEANS